MLPSAWTWELRADNLAVARTQSQQLMVGGPDCTRALVRVCTCLGLDSPPFTDMFEIMFGDACRVSVFLLVQSDRSEVFSRGKNKLTRRTDFRLPIIYMAWRNRESPACSDKTNSTTVATGYTYSTVLLMYQTLITDIFTYRTGSCGRCKKRKAPPPYS
jgi:hypothetical protein